MEKAILREKEVCEYISVTRAVLNTWRREGTFPSPIRLGTKAIGWKRAGYRQLDRVQAKRLKRLTEMSRVVTNVGTEGRVAGSRRELDSYRSSSGAWCSAVPAFTWSM